VVPLPFPFWSPRRWPRLHLACGHCRRPTRGPTGAGSNLVPETFAGSILGCAAAWLPHQAERVAVGEEDDRLRVLAPSM